MTNRNKIFGVTCIIFCLGIAAVTAQKASGGTAKTDNSIEAFINDAWEISAEAAEIKTAYQNACLSYDISIYGLYPQLSIELPQTVTRVTGADTYIQDQQLTLEGRYLLNSSAGIYASQKLPGGGNVLAQAAYTLSKVQGMQDYLQMPSFSLEINQPLGYGIAGFKNDPEQKKNRLALENARLTYKIAQNKFLLNIVEMLKQKDENALSCRYYELSVKSLSAKHNENQILKKQGRITESDSWKTDRGLLSARRNLAKAYYERDTLNADWQTCFGDCTIELTAEKRKTFIDQLSSYTESDLPDTVSSAQQQIQNRTEVALQKFREGENNHVPTISLSCSASPDTDAYYYYTKWNTSWEKLFSNPCLWEISFSVGLKYNIETFEEKHLRKELYKNSADLLTKSLEEEQKKDKLNRVGLIKKIQSIRTLRNEFEEEWENEEQSISDLEKLHAENLVTDYDYFSGQTESTAFEKDYADAEWNCIEDILNLAILTGAKLSFFTE
jgi:hypothetical protein